MGLIGGLLASKYISAMKEIMLQIDRYCDVIESNRSPQVLKDARMQVYQSIYNVTGEEGFEQIGPTLQRITSLMES